MLLVGSLFTGIGGMDLGFERAGMKTIWMCERDKSCIKLLNEKWKGVPIYGDVKELVKPKVKVPKIDVLVGGDPCPSHSSMRGGVESAHPDLSGYFLAVAGRLAPQWVVRENVPSPHVDHFAAALESLGYHTCVVWVNAITLTSQNREREFVIGCSNPQSIQSAFCQLESHKASHSQICDGKPSASCLVASSAVGCIRETHIWVPKRGIRGFTSQEREALAGFPIGWTDGFSETVRKRMLGNAIVPAVAQEIAVRIARVSGKIHVWPKLDIDAGIQRVLRKGRLV